MTKVIQSNQQLCAFTQPHKRQQQQQKAYMAYLNILGLGGAMIYNQPPSAATCSDTELDNYCFLLTGDVASCDWLITQSIVVRL